MSSKSRTTKHQVNKASRFRKNRRCDDCRMRWLRGRSRSQRRRNGQFPPHCPAGQNLRIFRCVSQLLRSLWPRLLNSQRSDTLRERCARSGSIARWAARPEAEGDRVPARTTIAAGTALDRSIRTIVSGGDADRGLGESKVSISLDRLCSRESKVMLSIHTKDRLFSQKDSSPRAKKNNKTGVPR